MAEQGYAFNDYKPEVMARALGRSLPISTKQAVEICNYLRNRKLQQAKELLSLAIAKKKAIPFKRFTNGLGHKPGKMAAGRFPVKASSEFMKLLESVEVNAQTKGLNTGELSLVHLCAHQAHRAMRNGRQRRRQFKATHVEVVVQETPEVKKKEKKAAPKPAAKPVAEKKEVQREPQPEAPKAEAKPEPKPEPKVEAPKVEEKKEEAPAEPAPAPEPKAQESKPEEKKAPEAPAEPAPAAEAPAEEAQK